MRRERFPTRRRSSKNRRRIGPRVSVGCLTDASCGEVSGDRATEATSLCHGVRGRRVWWQSVSAGVDVNRSTFKWWTQTCRRLQRQDKAHPNDEHTLADKRELSCHPDLGQDHLAAVPQDLLIAELLTGQRRLERTQLNPGR